MALGIKGFGISPVNAALSQTDHVSHLQQQQRAQEQQAKAAAEVHKDYAEQIQKIQEAVDQMDSIAKSINRKLSYSFNRELNQVIVKVVDSQTDKVIKELPPAELQRLHQKIQEYIGMIVDETA